MELDIPTLKESLDFLNDLYENVTSAIFLADGDARIRHFNDAFGALFHRMESDTIGALCGNAMGCCFTVDEAQECGVTSNCAFCPLRSDIIKSFVERVPVYKDSLSREFAINGSRRLMHFSFTTKYAVYHGTEYVLVIVDDVTNLEEARRTLEEHNASLVRHNQKLTQALRVEASELMEKARQIERLSMEKEDFLHEVSHRVGNNLQVISSLLNLECHDDEGIGEAEALRMRVNSVIEVYRHSFYDGSEAKVRVWDLIDSLIVLTLGSQTSDGKSVSSAIEKISMKFDVAVCLGIVFNEILLGLFDLRGCNSDWRKLKISLEQKLGKGRLQVECQLANPSPASDWYRESLEFARLIAEQVGGEVFFDQVNSDTAFTLLSAYSFPV